MRKDTFRGTRKTIHESSVTNAVPYSPYNHIVKEMRNIVVGIVKIRSKWENLLGTRASNIRNQLLREC